MRVALVPRAQQISRRLKAKGHRVESTDLGHLPGVVRRGAASPDPQPLVIVVADTARVSERARILSELRALASDTIWVFASDKLTAKMAADAGNAGAILTTIKGVPGTLSRLDRLILQKPGRFKGYLVPEFHAGAKGLIDAGRVAKAFGLAVTALAKGIGVTRSALTRRPTARAAQDGLRRLEFVWAVLREELGSDAKARAWLNAPHPELAGEPPMALLFKGSATALANFVESGLSGQPA